MSRDYTGLDSWIASYVNSSSFCKSLEATIEKVDNPAQRARLMLDLVDFIKPKLKNQEPPTPNDEKVITVQYELDDTGSETLED